MEKQIVILNTSEYSVKNITIFEENRIKLQFDKYTVKLNDKLLTLINDVEGSYDTLGLVEKQEKTPDVSNEKVFMIKKDRYVKLNISTNSLIYDNISYPITNISKKGDSVTVYKSEIGTLEISDSSKRISKWNGISIMPVI